MQFAHTVETTDGSVGLELEDGATIFDLVACGSNGQKVTVHLDYDRGQWVLNDAGSVRIAFGTRGAEERSSSTLGRVRGRDEPEGTVTFLVPAQASVYTMTVDDGGGERGARTTVTLRAAAHDSLIVGLSTLLSQL